MCIRDRAININGVTHIVLNKTDVLEDVKQWKLYHRDEVLTFKDGSRMYAYINENLSPPNMKARPTEVIFSGNKDGF